MRKVAVIRLLPLDLHKEKVGGGSVLATGHYESQRNDLAADFHDFCALNSLDRTEIKSAEYFIRELKAQKLLDDVKKDFE